MPPGSLAGMRIAIVGAGVSGGYLYRMLKKAGAESVDVFARKEKTACGIHSCAWMTSGRIFTPLREAGIQPEKYVLNHFDRIKIIDHVIGADIMVIDKPRMVKGLFEGAEIRYEAPDPTKYDRVIDATGASRAILPPVDSAHSDTVQHRVILDRPDDIIEINYTLVGYTWVVPLGDKLFHIGCGSHSSDQDSALEELYQVSQMKKVCSCRSRIRVTPPADSRPFVHGNIWGVGEAIGCVSPLIGEGIEPALKSAQLLLDNWDGAECYTRAILREFKWTIPEFRSLRRISASRLWGPYNFLIFRRCVARYGMKLGLMDGVKILRRIRK